MRQPFCQVLVVRKVGRGASDAKLATRVTGQVSIPVILQKSQKSVKSEADGFTLLIDLQLGYIAKHSLTSLDYVCDEFFASRLGESAPSRKQPPFLDLLVQLGSQDVLRRDFTLHHILQASAAGHSDAIPGSKVQRFWHNLQNVSYLSHPSLCLKGQ